MIYNHYFSLCVAITTRSTETLHNSLHFHSYGSMYVTGRAERSYLKGLGHEIYNFLEYYFTKFFVTFLLRTLKTKFQLASLKFLIDF